MEFEILGKKKITVDGSFVTFKDGDSVITLVTKNITSVEYSKKENPAFLIVSFLIALPLIYIAINNPGSDNFFGLAIGVVLVGGLLYYLSKSKTFSINTANGKISFVGKISMDTIQAIENEIKSKL